MMNLHLLKLVKLRHCQLALGLTLLADLRFLNKQLVDRMSKGGIIANVQPQFVPSDLPIIKSRVGEGGMAASKTYLWRTILD